MAGVGPLARGKERDQLPDLGTGGLSLGLRKPVRFKAGGELIDEDETRPSRDALLMRVCIVQPPKKRATVNADGTGSQGCSLGG